MNFFNPELELIVNLLCLQFLNAQSHISMQESLCLLSLD